VTGGAGFIGSHLVVHLVNEGHDVTILDNLSAGVWSNLDSVVDRVRRVEGDVRDDIIVESLLRDAVPDIVFHLAANASVPKSVTNPAEDFDINCNGTVKLLDATRKTGSRARMVLASSGAVYGEPIKQPISETAVLNPISPYGASKMTAENEARMYQKLYGVDVTIARIFNTYGPRMPRFVVLDFLKKLSSNPEELEILGSGEQVRDFTYVDDTVSGLLLLAEHGVRGESYNIASGRSASVLELAGILLEILKLSGHTRIRTTGASWLGDAQRWEVDISKLSALGYSARSLLKEGLECTIAWYRAAVLKGVVEN